MPIRLFNKQAPSGRVLVVEDDSMLSMVMAESFKAEKFKVSVVADGSKVLAEVARFSPDIIILDLILPGLDGFAVLKQLKGDARTEKIPIIAISNLGAADMIVDNTVIDQYFSKANARIDEIVDYAKNILKRPKS